MIENKNQDIRLLHKQNWHALIHIVLGWKIRAYAYFFDLRQKAFIAFLY